MLDINLFRDSPEVIRKALRDRQMDPGVVNNVLELDDRRRQIIQEVEQLKAERNTVSKEIGRMRDPEERQVKIEAMREVGVQIAELDEALRAVEYDLNQLMISIPNVPDGSVPYGMDESENQVVRVVGQLPEFDFKPVPHWDLGPAMGIINFEQGVKITGSRFYVLSGAGARLQRALVAWMLDLHIRQGYTEKYTPFMVKEQTLLASGQLPKFYDNLYRDA